MLEEQSFRKKDRGEVEEGGIGCWVLGVGYARFNSRWFIVDNRPYEQVAGYKFQVSGFRFQVSGCALIVIVSDSVAIPYEFADR